MCFILRYRKGCHDTLTCSEIHPMTWSHQMNILNNPLNNGLGKLGHFDKLKDLIYITHKFLIFAYLKSIHQQNTFIMKTLILTLILISLNCFAQIIPSERSYDFKSAGFGRGQKPEITKTINIMDFGGDASGDKSNNEALNSAMNSAKGSAVRIYFPSGIYNFDKPIVLRDSIVIAGSGIQGTFFQMNPEFGIDCIKVHGQIDNIEYKVIDSIRKNDDNIFTNNNDSILLKDWLLLYQKDTSLLASTWAFGSIGQIVRINSKVTLDNSINNLFFFQKIRKQYKLSDSIYIRKVKPIQCVGIENLTLTRPSTKSFQTSNIAINYAVNCWVECVESINANFANVAISNSSNISVTGCYFHDPVGFGGGGEGYGVVLQFTSGECLIENNYFKRLRHSVLLQAGANGNVIAYNYSTDPYWTDTQLPENSAGDMVLHGNYPYANLFEGNLCQNIVIDNSHGLNGPDNTFFRNRAELYGIFMNSSPASDGQIFVGNEVTNPDLFFGLYVLAGKNHIEYSNNIKGNITPANTNVLDIKSLYYNNSPYYFNSGFTIFPSFGYPNTGNKNEFPVKRRIQQNAEFALCGSPMTNLQEEAKTNNFAIYPNPTNDKFILNTYQKTNAILFDINGKTIDFLNFDNSIEYDTQKLANGSYYIVFFRNGEKIVLPLIVNK